jgi:hypothetical protein
MIKLAVVVITFSLVLTCFGQECNLSKALLASVYCARGQVTNDTIYF